MGRDFRPPLTTIWKPLILSYLLKVTKFLVKISQFKFLVKNFENFENLVGGSPPLPPREKGEGAHYVLPGSTKGKTYRRMTSFLQHSYISKLLTLEKKLIHNILK